MIHQTQISFAESVRAAGTFYATIAGRSLEASALWALLLWSAGVAQLGKAPMGGMLAPWQGAMPMWHNPLGKCTEEARAAQPAALEEPRVVPSYRSASGHAVAPT